MYTSISLHEFYAALLKVRLSQVFCAEFEPATY